MAQPFRAPRRQSYSVYAIDLGSPIHGQSTSEDLRRTVSTQGTQPHASGGPSKSRRKKEEGLWPVAEEAAFIKLPKQEKIARAAGEVMIQGEQRFTRMCLKLNQQFHDRNPEMYVKKEWKQIRSKESNLRSLCKEVLGKMFGASAAKTITGAATGPGGEIIQECAEDAPGRPVLSHGPSRFMHPDEVGADEIDIGDREWANFAQYREVFKNDATLLCPTTREAGDGRMYSSRNITGLDMYLEGGLEDDGQSPPTKRAKKTPGQSRLARQDHSESRMLHYFEESDKLHRLDAEAERAHQREMEAKRLADKDKDRAQLTNLLTVLVTAVAGGAAAAPLAQAAAAPQPRPMQPAFHPHAAMQPQPQRPAVYPHAAMQPQPVQPAPLPQVAPQPRPLHPALNPQAAMQPQPSRAVQGPQVGSQAQIPVTSSPVAPHMPASTMAAVQAGLPAGNTTPMAEMLPAPKVNPAFAQASTAASVASESTAGVQSQSQNSAGARRGNPRDRKPPAALRDYAAD